MRAFFLEEILAWIEWHDDIWEHHKTVRMAALIRPFVAGGIPDEDLIGLCVSYLGRLWHFVLRNAWKDADLEPWGDLGIERACKWHGEAGKLVAAMRNCGSKGGHGFMVGFVAYGWQERAGRLVYDRLRKEGERLSAAKRRKNGGKSKATVPYPTVPNRTKPNTTIQTDMARHIPPKREWVEKFCREVRNNGVDVDSFMSHYESNGWKVGKNPMKNWKASICSTWEKDGRGPRPKVKLPVVSWSCKTCGKGRPEVQPDPEAWDGGQCKTCSKELA